MHCVRVRVFICSDLARFEPLRVIYTYRRFFVVCVCEYSSSNYLDVIGFGIDFLYGRSDSLGLTKRARGGKHRSAVAGIKATHTQTRAYVR